MNDDIVTAVFKSDQRIISLGIIPQHSVMLLKLKVYIVNLYVKYRLVNVSFTTAENCFLKPTHVCGIHHILWQRVPPFNYDICGMHPFLGFMFPAS